MKKIYYNIKLKFFARNKCSLKILKSVLIFLSLLLLISLSIFILISEGYSKNIKYKWTKIIYRGQNEINWVSLDTFNNNIYITGNGKGDINFAADWGLNEIINDITYNKFETYGFITKISLDGSYKGTTFIKFPDYDVNQKYVKIDNYGNMFLLGKMSYNYDALYKTNYINFGGPWNCDDTKSIFSRGFLYITKINSNGSYAWTKVIGNRIDYFSGEIKETILDKKGNLIILGSGFDFNTLHDINFAQDWGGNDTKSINNNSYIFITKINSDGTYGWTKIIKSSSKTALWGADILADNRNNIYILGNFEGSINFGDDWNIFDKKTSMGGVDIFIMKLNMDGKYYWTKRIGGVGEDRAFDIAVDRKGNLFIVGEFTQTVFFGSDWKLYNKDKKISYGNSDGFITKINANGSYGWTKIFGEKEIDGCYSVTIDKNNNILVAGSIDPYEGYVNLGRDWEKKDIKKAKFNKEAKQYDSMEFIVKLDSNGTYIWSKVSQFIRDIKYINNILLLYGFIEGEFGQTIQYFDFGKVWGTKDIKSGEGFFITLLEYK